MPISIPTAGELNKRVTFISRVETPTSIGTAEVVDTDIATVWAKIEPTGSFNFGGVQTSEQTTHRLWIRTQKGVLDDVTIGHGVYVKYGTRLLKPVRTTDANGGGKFTVIEAMDLGEFDKASESGVAEVVEELG